MTGLRITPVNTIDVYSVSLDDGSAYNLQFNFSYGFTVNNNEHLLNKDNNKIWYVRINGVDGFVWYTRIINGLDIFAGQATQRIYTPDVSKIETNGIFILDDK